LTSGVPDRKIGWQSYVRKRLPMAIVILWRQRFMSYSAKQLIIMVLMLLQLHPGQAVGLQIQELDENLKPVQTTADQTNLADFRLEDAIKIALKANKSIISAEMAYKKAEAQVLQARSITGLKLTGNLTHTRLDEITSADFGGQKIALSKLDNQKIWLELSQPLFLGLKDRAAIRSSRLGREISEALLKLTRQQTILAASIGFYSWLYAREVAEVSQMNLNLAQAHFDLVKRRFNAQQASKYELLRAEVRLVQTQSDLLKEKNDAELTRLELLKLLSIPLNSDLETSMKLEPDLFTADLEKDLKTAEATREDLKIRALEKKLADQAVIAARGEKQPTVALFGQYGSENPSSKSGFGSLQRKDYWLAGLSVNLPFIDAGLSSGRLLEAKSDMALSQNNFENSLEMAQLEIRKAALNLNTTEQIVSAQRQNLKQAEETMRLAKVRYENGMFTQVDLFDAETAWSNAHLMYIQSVFLHHQARLSYLLATGKLGNNIMTSADNTKENL